MVITYLVILSIGATIGFIIGYYPQQNKVNENLRELMELERMCRARELVIDELRVDARCLKKSKVNAAEKLNKKVDLSKPERLPKSRLDYTLQNNHPEKLSREELLEQIIKITSNNSMLVKISQNISDLNEFKANLNTKDIIMDKQEKDIKKLKKKNKKLKKQNKTLLKIIKVH